MKNRFAQSLVYNMNNYTKMYQHVVSTESTGHLISILLAQGISLSADAPISTIREGKLCEDGCSKDLYLEDEVGQEDQAEQVWDLKTVKI